MGPAAVLHHLGSLHTYETALVLVIAFGPFLVIAALVRREHRRATARERAGAARRTGGFDGRPRSSG